MDQYIMKYIKGNDNTIDAPIHSNHTSLITSVPYFLNITSCKTLLSLICFKTCILKKLSYCL